MSRGATLGHPRPRLSLHSKIVLTTSAALIVLGAGALLLVEAPGGAGGVVGRVPITGDGSTPVSDWRSLSGGPRVREAVFQSVSARTAGFNTINMDELTNAGKLWMCGLMVVGGSPASTAGGMKTVTFALLVMTAYGVLRRRRELEVFGRSLPGELLRRAVTLTVLYLSLVGLVTVVLCVRMPTRQMIDLLFEACSACGTVGLSTGATRMLDTVGKAIIIGGMYLGRIGPLTLLLALTSGVRPVNYRYPREHVVIG